MAEELWSRLGHRDTLAYEPFPEVDPALLVDETVEVPVQVNGKVRASGCTCPPARTPPPSRPPPGRTSEVAALLAGTSVRKVVAVPGRLVNFVVS